MEDELKNCQELYQNLMEEKELESCDDRRAFLLKSQIFQLERQCMLLSQAQSSRTLILNEIENQLLGLIQDFQNMLSSKNPGPNLEIKRSQLTSIIGTLQKLKNSLYKQSAMEKSDMSVPSVLSGCKYAKEKQEITCLDVCSGKTEYLNLRQIASLEIGLSKLYKELSSLEYLIEMSLPKDHLREKRDRVQTLEAPESQLYSRPLNRIRAKCEDCLKDLTHCRDELVMLSILHPSAPWSVTRKREEFGLLNAERIIKNLPTLVQRKPEVVHCIRAMCKVHSYVSHMNRLQLSSARSQLRYHSQIYKQQCEYISSLFNGVMKAYQECEEGIVSTVTKPLTEILESWERLKADQSNEHLKKFLDIFKLHENTLLQMSMLQSSKDTSNGILVQLKSSLDISLKKLEEKYRQNFTHMEKTIEDHNISDRDDIVQCLKLLHVS